MSSAKSQHDNTAQDQAAAGDLGLPLRPRTAIVWGSFLACMTVAALLLSMTGGGLDLSAPGRSITPLVRAGTASGLETVLTPRSDLDRGRWDSIVIHHAATPAATPESIDEAHRRAGLSRLGYHFVIGNGRRMGDGEIHVGSRWLEQLPGAHVAGPSGTVLNQTSIGICLVGDGDRGRFTESQMTALTEIIRMLQFELGIPADRVALHRDVAGTTSPGRFFPEASFRAALATELPEPIVPATRGSPVSAD
ncbi:MAG: peptidoglycan recognition family protein [Planctomycetota bacterium]